MQADQRTDTAFSPKNSLKLVLTIGEFFALPFSSLFFDFHLLINMEKSAISITIMHI